MIKKLNSQLDDKIFELELVQNERSGPNLPKDSMYRFIDFIVTVYCVSDINFSEFKN